MAAAVEQPEGEQWASRWTFLLAAVGSAIGLGNIWRFPYVAYDNGGGAFFVPYLFALLTAGIPVLILEYTLGHRLRGSAPLSLRRLSRGTEWIGWWQVVVGFVISSYYAVVIAWALAYAWFAFGTRWGDDPGTFFEASFLQAGEPGQVGGLVPGVLLPLVIVWAITLFIGYRGIKRGIEAATRIMIPLLCVTFGALVIRAVTLPGAVEGLTVLFQPDFSALADSRVWIAAYGQIFFTLSIAFAIMITYASYLPRKADLTNNAFIAAFANSSFELLAGLGVFAALGFIAVSQGIGVDEVAEQGVGLAFVAFPEIINALPALNSLFGVLFFGSLVLAGLSSLISIVEVFVAALRDKFQLSRARAVALGGGACAMVSLLFTSHGGLYLLDTADTFINNFGVALVGLAEVVAIAWFLRRLGPLQRHADRVSDIGLGPWWKVSLLVITPLMLGFQAFDSIRRVIIEGYEDYPTALLLSAGWAVALFALAAGVLLSLRPWDAQVLHLPDSDRGEVASG